MIRDCFREANTMDMWDFLSTEININAMYYLCNFFFLGIRNHAWYSMYYPKRSSSTDDPTQCNQPAYQMPTDPPENLNIFSSTIYA